MFKQTIIIFLLVVGAIISILSFRWGVLTDEQRQEYLELIALSRSEEKEQTTAFKQQKKNIQKDVYVNDIQGRLHVRVVGVSAEMCCEKGDNGTDMVEKMQQVHCLMQEQLYEEDGKQMQILRVVNAESAEYHYRNSRFLAKKVKMFRYSIPGHVLVEPSADAKPLIAGTADSVTFLLNGDDLNFHAENFHGVVVEGVSL